MVSYFYHLVRSTGVEQVFEQVDHKSDFIPLNEALWPSLDSSNHTVTKFYWEMWIIFRNFLDHYLPGFKFWLGRSDEILQRSKWLPWAVWIFEHQNNSHSLGLVSTRELTVYCG